MKFTVIVQETYETCVYERIADDLDDALHQMEQEYLGNRNIESIKVFPGTGSDISIKQLQLKAKQGELEDELYDTNMQLEELRSRRSVINDQLNKIETQLS